MNDRLFADLQLPAPDLNLEVGSGTHAVQTAEIMRRFEPVLDQHRPCCVIVVGDVNSTLACSLVAVKKGVPVVHVEAGLRSFDRAMPEEINRVLTDQIADLLYTTERSAATNLAREGIPAERIRFVGNVMIDSLRANLPRAVPPAETLRRAGLDPAPVRTEQRVRRRHAASAVERRPAGIAPRMRSRSCARRARSCRSSGPASAHARQHRAFRAALRCSTPRRSLSCRRRATSRCSA